MSENPSGAVGGMYPSEHHNPIQAVHPTMHLPGQIEDVHGGGNSGGVAQMMVMPHEAQHYVAEQEHGVVHGNPGVEGMEEDHDGAVEGDGMEGEVPPDAGNMGIMVAPGVGNQLTLSFQGEVYVFDSVSPEKDL